MFYRKSKYIQLEAITSVLLILSTIAALSICNSPYKDLFYNLFHNTYIAKNFSLHNFVNDFLMSIFFLLAGLEIKQEILYGSLSSFKKASFPVIASIGGTIIPAWIFLFFNFNTDYISGVCIPISTDIAFSMGIFFLFSKYLNPNSRLFLLSLAVVDDLISIFMIGTIYSTHININFIILGSISLLLMYICNKIFYIENPIYYIVGGLCLWYFVHLSGIHSTVSGILLAIVIPSKSNKNNVPLSQKLQKSINPISSLLIIPLFAFANTGISISSTLELTKYPSLFLGIYFGLLIGKPLGIMSFSFISCFLGISKKPITLDWLSIFLVSLIAGIGFTMSIFVSEVAFVGNNEIISLSRIYILISSIMSITLSSFTIITLKELHITKY